MHTCIDRIRVNTAIIFIIAIGISMALTAPALAGPKLYKGEWITPKNYPDGFHGIGRVDRISPEAVVIDDSIKPLSPKATYHTPSSRYTRQSSIKTGDLVGYLKDRHGRIISLWKIPED